MRVLSIFIIATAGVLTFAGTAIFRRYSLRREWLDVPNQRSSHDRPTPRGAGLVVVPVCLIGYLVSAQLTGTRFSCGYFAGALLVALVSWLDDLYTISIIWRLLTHLSAGLIVVASEGYWRCSPFGNGTEYSLAWLEPAGTVLWIVWMVNAYNFMDGIDGIAALQGLVAAAAWAVIAAGSQNSICIFAPIVFASLVGFVLHNWYPAKVFIGDVGSAFLGFTFASIPLMLAGTDNTFDGILALASILILWPFLFDTLSTLVKRLVRGERVWQAHREHLYQLLVMSGLSHPAVAIIYGTFAVITSTGAVLLVNGLVDPIIVMGFTLLMSGLFALGVALTCKGSFANR